MCCDRLVCARCSGLVAHGGCSTCREAHERLHQRSVLTPAAWLALAAALAASVLAGLRPLL